MATRAALAIAIVPQTTPFENIGGQNQQTRRFQASYPENYQGRKSWRAASMPMPLLALTETDDVGRHQGRPLRPYGQIRAETRCGHQQQSFCFRYRNRHYLSNISQRRHPRNQAPPTATMAS